MRPFPGPVPYPDRWDKNSIEERIRKERSRLGWASDGHFARKRRKPLPYRLAELFLCVSGLYRRGHRNFLNPRFREIEHPLPAWPADLDGFRLLQLSDLHIDLDPRLVDPVRAILRRTLADLCVITGDFWEGGRTDHQGAPEALEAVLRNLPRGVAGPFGVLGNHDAIACGAWLESRGLRILLNEAVEIRPEGINSSFALAGVDDAYYFASADVARAAAQCPPDRFRLLLSHSPQTAPAAARHGFNLLLSGHTHGGQIRFPGGFGLRSMPGIPRKYFRGLWQEGLLRGYTSSGTGACHIPLRFHCPGEIVLHRLRSRPD
ncbi:MAG: metallophosphoesterase [Verrucomicrobia bacterium]|jgi:predicted MPP superfamily phosphohydrolase|nr:metallophosphoesterase [Verrucomicrobiota bacterium]